MSPDQHTLQETFIEVGDGHTLYLQEWGNAKGMPIIFLHGGPGGGSKDRHKQAFDPGKHRVIFFDQRGCGRSIPYGSLGNNTTQKLIADIEKIADHFKLKDFTFVGGSWGSCLALAYALVYPKRVKRMVLASIFTAAQDEIDFIYQGGAATHFPEAWETYLAATPKEHHKDPASYHFTRTLGNDKQASKASAYVLENLERALLSLDDRFMPDSFEDFDPTSSLIETHYQANRCFLPDGYVMENAHKLTMPVWLIHGRYDMVCAPRVAYKLHKKLPDSELVWVIGGHRSEHEAWGIQRTILTQLAQDQGVA